MVVVPGAFVEVPGASVVVLGATVVVTGACVGLVGASVLAPQPARTKANPRAHSNAKRLILFFIKCFLLIYY